MLVLLSWIQIGSLIDQYKLGGFIYVLKNWGSFVSRLLKRVVLVTGRYLAENPYRELIIKRLLESYGVQVKLVVPSRKLNKAAFLDDITCDPVFKKEGAICVEGEWEFRKSIRGCQMVVFSAWRSYEPLVRLAQTEGRLTLNFCATSGLDHWTNGVERCLTRSPFTIRVLRFAHEQMGLSMPSEDQMRIVGSLQYEYLEDTNPIGFDNRESFCRHYGLQAQRPIAVLFPKGIQSFHKKVAIWFSDWNQEQVDSYNQFFLDKYGEICRQVQQAGYNLIIKMHPTAYIAYNCNKEQEYEFWQQYPWAKVLDPTHTRAMYCYADVGLGINTHSALDMGYFKKPFIYVDSDLIQPPDLPTFKMSLLGKLIQGPSSHWHTQPITANLWFWSWLGAFSRAEDLADLLTHSSTSLTINQADWEAFIEEYWGSKDNKVSTRIVEEILAFGDERLSSWRFKWTLRYGRGWLWDKIEWLRHGNSWKS